MSEVNPLSRNGFLMSGTHGYITGLVRRGVKVSHGLVWFGFCMSINWLGWINYTFNAAYGLVWIVCISAHLQGEPLAQPLNKIT